MPQSMPRQLAWASRGFSVFVHLGANTFTGREWGDGRDSAIYNPVWLDALQWVCAAKCAGAKGMVFTSKYHSGEVSAFA